MRALIFLGTAVEEKMIDQYQPRARISSRNENAKQEIRSFFLAINSYPDRAAKDPSLTFQEYLSNFLAAGVKDSTAS